MTWDFLAFVVFAIIFGVVAISLQFDLAPRNPKWRRIWAWFAYGAMGLFLLWMVILIGFVRPRG